MKTAAALTVLYAQGKGPMAVQVRRGKGHDTRVIESGPAGADAAKRLIIVKIP